jgi:hypothetical protein
MGTIQTQVGVEEMTLQVTVLRCTCGKPEDHFGSPCPLARREPQGTTAYFHTNPMMRLAYRVARWWNPRCTFRSK